MILASATPVTQSAFVVVDSGPRHDGLLQISSDTLRRGMGWLGKAGPAWQGEAGMACLGMARQDTAEKGTFGCP